MKISKQREEILLQIATNNEPLKISVIAPNYIDFTHLNQFVIFER